MKAIVLKAYGDADQLQLQDVPEPQPEAGELKVRMAGVSLNPIDWKLRSGAYQKYMPLDLPAILGRDVSGEVVGIGLGVTGFEVGDRVLGLVNKGYAEYVVASAGSWAKVPAGLDLADAAALPLVLLTGAQLAEEAVAPRPGDRVLVTGATGGVGRAAVFAAKALKAKVYAGVRGKWKDEASKLGVEGVVALDDERSLAELAPLDAIADTVGGDTIQKLLGKVKPGGVIGSVVGDPPGAKERGLTAHRMMTHPDAKRLGELAADVAAGRLVIPIAKRFPLAETAAAHKLAESGSAGGKVLLRP